MYLWLSAACSLGAGCHPCLLFWIMQHACVPHMKHQPSLSYGGSPLLHALHFGALFHAEHHDFPHVTYLAHRVPHDPRARPRVLSTRAFLFAWLRGSYADVDIAGYDAYSHATLNWKAIVEVQKSNNRYAQR